MKIYLFDDDDLVRTMLTAALVRQGYDVEAFAAHEDWDGCRIERCECNDESCCADVIISDFDMPSMNGLEFFKKVQAGGCRVRQRAIITGLLTSQIKNAAAEMDCAVFSKPFHLQDIYFWLEQCEPLCTRKQVLRQHSTTLP